MLFHKQKTIINADQLSASKQAADESYGRHSL